MLELLQKKHRDLFAKAEALLGCDSQTPEMMTEAEVYLTDCETIKKQIDLLLRAKTAQEWSAQPAEETKALPMGGTVIVPETFKSDKSGSDSAASVTAIAERARFASVKNFKPEHVIDTKTGEVVHRTAEEKAYRFGMWFLSAVLGQEPAAKHNPVVQKAIEFCKEQGIETKVHVESNNASGGSLVAPEFNNDMIDLREKYGVFRRNAKIVPMSSDTRSDPRRTGGLTAYFIGEAAQITESTKGWDRVGLTAKKLAVLSRISSELNEDAIINIGDDLAGEIAYAFANKEDDCGFNGDGTSPYGGIVGLSQAFLSLNATVANIAGITLTPATGGSNDYSKVTLNNFLALQGNLPQYAAARPDVKWYMHRSIYYNTALELALAAGGVTEAEILGAGATEPRFIGYPVEFTQIMPKAWAANQIFAYFGSLPLSSSFGERRMTTIALSEHLNFDYDELAIRGTERFDINNHDVGNASATVSLRVPGPIVALATNAT